MSGVGNRGTTPDPIWVTGTLGASSRKTLGAVEYPGNTKLNTITEKH
jgi:hypothetical protein